MEGRRQEEGRLQGMAKAPAVLRAGGAWTGAAVLPFPANIGPATDCSLFAKKQ